MWADWLAEFGSEHIDGQDFIQSAQSAGVNLHDVYGIIRDKLLEQNSVLAMLAGGNFYVANTLLAYQ